MSNKKDKKTKARSSKNVSKAVRPGSALRSRDEYFYGGKPKDRPNDKQDELYRVVYVIETNSLDELAVVKSTTSKGHHLKSKPDKKFRPTVYILDDEGKPIKISDPDALVKKFVRNSANDINDEDVDHIRKRTYKHADSNVKIAQLKSRSKRDTKRKK